MQNGLKSNKGFTLVEMAIVLVIIGIILGAVVKGQDLIVNAQAKQIIAAGSSWRNLMYAFVDRNGRMPGDESRNGIIGDVPATETTANLAGINELVLAMQNAPLNPVTIGSMSFWFYPGFVTVTTTAGPTGSRNALFVCKDANCSTAITDDELEIFKAMDTAFDGVADAGMGQFRAFTARDSYIAATTIQGRASGTPSITTTASIPGAGTTVTGATTAWATTQHGAVWLFDRPFP